MISRKNMLYFVDIGQGNSSVIQKKIGGKYSYRGRWRGNRYFTGKLVLFIYSLKRNIQKVDLLIILYFYSDHSGGVNIY